MKQLKNIALTVLAVMALSLTACQSNTAKKAETQQTVQESMAWVGTYHGVLPCADCSGNDTLITLFDNGQFKKTETSLDNADMRFTDHGEMQWDATGSIVTLVTENNDAMTYQVTAEQLVMLGADGQPAGELAEQYTLKKQVETVETEARAE